MGATTIAYATPLRRISRHLVSRSGTFVPTGVYATGGDSFVPVYGKSLLSVQFENPAGRILQFDSVNGKVKWFEDGATVSGALDEVPNGTDLTGAQVRWTTLGKK
jgi:hypothetical protein